MKARAARTVRMARALHRACFVFVPRDVRRSYRAEMIATFDAALADAARRGAVAVWTLLLTEIKDLAHSRRANVPQSLAFPDDHSAPTKPAWIESSLWVQAFRSLRRRPAFLVAAVLTLAFGTAITTTVFSLVDTVLLKPLPYPGADRLVTIYESSSAAREKTSLVAPARLEDWNRLNRTFVALSGSYTENVTDTSGPDPERLAGRRVMPRFFSVYGTAPLAGRTFTEEEERENGPGAAVISEPFSMRRFNGHPAALGRLLVIGGRPYAIVGVMPAAFTNAAIDVWLPAQLSSALMRVRQARFLGGIGRLRPGVPIEQAAQDLAAVQAGLAREFPGTDAEWSAEIGSLKEARVGGARRGLAILFGAVGLLWLIAVANVAGLTIVQVHRRSRELAIRSALGASRLRVVATMLREGVIVAVLGGACGTALAAWLVGVLRAVLTATPRIEELTLDPRALAFATGTSLLAACAFSIVPALGAVRARFGPTLSAVRTSTGGQHHIQKSLVVVQVALSVMLVGSAMLLLRSYHKLTHVETGFDPADVITFHVGARWDEDRSRIGLLQQQLIERLEELPHVQAAGMANFLPATGATLRYQVHVEGLAGQDADGAINAGLRMIGGGYLRAIRAPLLAGSWCPARSMAAGAPGTAMINQRLVELHAPGQNLVGRSLRLGQIPTARYTIAGIVGNLIEDGHGSPSAPYVYTCDPPGSWPDPEYVVRTADPRALAADLRRLVRELDPGRAVFGMRPLQEVVEASLDRPRLDAVMLALFAASAVMLAAIGLYSLFMLLVTERAREMAVRLALGAAPSQIIGLITTGAGRLLGAGLLVGLGLTLAAGRVLSGMLFGISAFDGPSLAAAAGALALAAAVSVAAPALRAARIAPLIALREE